MHHADYKEGTKKEKAIIFIHGFIGTPNHFRRFYPLIPETMTIYNLLLEGHGGSVEDFSKASMTKWKNQVQQTLNEAKENHQEIYLVGHSMGTLLCMDAFFKSSNKIAGMYLLAVPLHVHITPLAIYNAIGTIFKLNDTNNPQLQAAKAMYSVQPDARIWKYIRWLPRYYELLKLCRDVRQKVTKIDFFGVVIQSRKDELVSNRSNTYFKDPIVLENSTHYFYTESDLNIVMNEFKNFVSK